MKHRNRISRTQRAVLYLSTVALLVSAALWLSVRYLAWPAMAQPALEGLPSPWLAYLMKVHGAAMMVMLFIVGRLSGTHVMKGWRLHWRRSGGVALLVGVAALALTGYGMYYLVPEDWRDAVGLAHAAAGAAWCAILLVHRRHQQGDHPVQGIAG